jgi:hypothetical protein
VSVLAAGVTHAAVTYPLTLNAKAEVKTETVSATATVTIRVERLMRETVRTRVVDGLKYGGYSGFVNALREAPVVGSIEVNGRKVDLRYAWEQPGEKGRRLTLVGDRPLAFLGGANPNAPSRKGFELTVVDLQVDDQGNGSGMMVAAARVKPSGDGGVILDDYAEAPISITVRAGQK